MEIITHRTPCTKFVVVLDELFVMQDALIDIFNSPEFSKFKDTLDAYMKQRKSNAAYEKKKANTTSEELEDVFWEKELLGDSNPLVLLDTMVYYLGYYFALRSGMEQQCLRYYPSQ